MTLPNGSKFSSSAECPEVRMKWNNSVITTQAHVADLKDWNIILGVEWLCQLGDFQCNYLNSTMQFSWNGNDIILSSSTCIEI